ncbi:MAG: RimK/LysX family protein [Candidatus Hinthialibacter antarcticus]|nr:RimK/LysX family protein [Candidatus Hinthialibacter antarcticus]
MEQEKTVIGWVEPVELVDWGIGRIRAKVDTGARSSALHVDELVDLGDGRIQFYVVLSRKNQEKRVQVVAPLLKTGQVRSSTGKYTTRYFVNTRVRIGHIEKDIEISLVCRKKMIFRMLLGRRALAHDFVVDVSRRDTLRKRKRERTS